MKSPNKKKPNPGWKKKPTFFTGQEQQEKRTEPEPEPEKKEERKHEKKSERAPVKTRIQNINKKSSGSPAKVPEWKQVKLAHYFGRKSPKASEARETQPETTTKQNRGLKAPFQENLVSRVPKHKHPRDQVQHLRKEEGF